MEPGRGGDGKVGEIVGGKGKEEEQAGTRVRGAGAWALCA